MVSTHDLLKRLNDHGVEYVIVGGLAGVIHGSSIVTEDVDVCAPMTPENIERIVAAFRGTDARHRMNPVRPPLPEDPAALAGYKNLYLVTSAGQIDVLSEISGIGDFARASEGAIKVDLGGIQCPVISIDNLIASKRAMGRPKDIQSAIELEAIRERMRGASGD